MHGAASKRNEIYLEERDVIVTELSTVRLRWIKKTDEKQKKQARMTAVQLLELYNYRALFHK